MRGGRAQPPCPRANLGAISLYAAAGYHLWGPLPKGPHPSRNEMGVQGLWCYMGMSAAGDASPLPQSRRHSGGSPSGWGPLPTLLLNLGP